MEINWVAELFDTIASMSGWVGRWLNANKKRSCFIIWSICTTYWAIRDFYIGLYSQALFCSITIAINIYGYIKWREKPEKKTLSAMPTIQMSSVQLPGNQLEIKEEKA